MKKSICKLIGLTLLVGCGSESSDNPSINGNVELTKLKRSMTTSHVANQDECSYIKDSVNNVITAQAVIYAQGDSYDNVSIIHNINNAFDSEGITFDFTDLDKERYFDNAASIAFSGSMKNGTSTVKFTGTESIDKKLLLDFINGVYIQKNVGFHQTTIEGHIAIHFEDSCDIEIAITYYLDL